MYYVLKTLLEVWESKNKKYCGNTSWQLGVTTAFTSFHFLLHDSLKAPQSQLSHKEIKGD